MARLWTFVCALLLSALALSAQADGKLTMQWLGQSAIKLTSPDGKVIMIDPFLTKDPATPAKYKDLKAIGPVDLILVTHAHGDHFGDTAALAKLTGATVALNADFASTLRTLGVIPGKQLLGFNKGGPIQPLGPGITITMTHAEHSSDFIYTNPVTDKPQVYPGGEPAGYIIRFANGFTIYDMGDTDVFGDMAWIGSYYHPDLALVPIGGHYTMDPAHAAYAVEKLVKPKMVLPFHYGTFPALTGTPEAFKAALGKTSIKVLDMKPGDSVTLP
ncbi:metal-dependent hydrolase [Mangrovitalea sediminis]|uniref:metal-dependent hydrolase n=1 Tax=Mangrovitalea sediminis TaxID=1982043 RepID=UPI0018EA0350|nr:metal-dependent hydrolase [Mangrovitalea sediminis]